jgi:hypothetical protein
VKGSVCAETNALGTRGVHQKALFSEAIEYRCYHKGA